MPPQGSSLQPWLSSGIILLAGPTAVGKSAIALPLAEKIGGEIISVDSMQVYRGLDIGTAKLSLAERARVPHHLVDVVEVNEPFDAARFVRLARQAMDEIRSRGNVPILCGGTGLYFKALLEGLGESPAANVALRADLAKTPLPQLLEELAQRDPVTYERIDRKNPRRVLRAIEVIRLTGRPYSIQRARWGTGQPSASLAALWFGLSRESSDLQRRIGARVQKMFRTGLVEETKALLARGLAQNPIAMQALGYRQVVEHLDGKRSLEQTMELVKIRTRQYAKRQMTWFRRQLRLNWVRLEDDQLAETVADRLAQRIQPYE